MQALNRIEAHLKIGEAAVEDLFECPFCNEMRIDDNNSRTTYTCPDCLKASCKQCCKAAHGDASCHANDDSLSQARHRIAEEMTSALVRKCNKCKTPFLKESGCNKMTCPKCQTKMCYVCKKTVKNYSHFGAVCPLFDSVVARHNNDISNAQEAAVNLEKAKNKGFQDTHLTIDKTLAHIPNTVVQGSLYRMDGPVRNEMNAQNRELLGLLGLNEPHRHADRPGIPAAIIRQRNHWNRGLQENPMERVLRNLDTKRAARVKAKVLTRKNEYDQRRNREQHIIAAQVRRAEADAQRLERAAEHMEAARHRLRKYYSPMDRMSQKDSCNIGPKPITSACESRQPSHDKTDRVVASLRRSNQGAPRSSPITKSPATSIGGGNNSPSRLGRCLSSPVPQMPTPPRRSYSRKPVSCQSIEPRRRIKKALLSVAACDVPPQTVLPLDIADLIAGANNPAAVTVQARGTRSRTTKKPPAKKLEYPSSQ